MKGIIRNWRWEVWQSVSHGGISISLECGEIIPLFEQNWNQLDSNLHFENFEIFIDSSYLWITKWLSPIDMKQKAVEASPSEIGNGSTTFPDEEKPVVLPN